MARFRPQFVEVGLEADWNERLRDLVQAQDQYERQRIQDRMKVDEAQRRQILELTQDFPALWSHPQTTHRDRKRMLELLIEDVTLTRGEQVTAQVRFRGGATTTLSIPLPLNAWQGRQTPPAAVAQLDELLNQHTYRQVAQCLNQRGYVNGAGVPFSSASVQWVQEYHKLKSYKDRLLERGMLTPHQIAQRCGIPYNTVKFWRQKGRIHGIPCNDRGHWLYYPSVPEKHSKMKGDQEISPSNRSTTVEIPQKGYEV